MNILKEVRSKYKISTLLWMVGVDQTLGPVHLWDLHLLYFILIVIYCVLTVPQADPTTHGLEGGLLTYFFTLK